MKITILLMLTLMLTAAPAQARHHRDVNGYTDSNGVYHEYVENTGYRFDHQQRKVQAHKERRNILLGVGAVGLLTGSRAATVIGLGGAAANEVVDRRHRDW